MLLGFDYDGTLAPLVTARAGAHMRPVTRRLLKRVTMLYPSVVISGRAHGDVARRLRGVPVCRVVGNHGAEHVHGSVVARRRVTHWLPVLERRLSTQPGVEIEDKRFSVAVHYRSAKNRERARRLILEAVAELADVRVVGGKLVLNLVAPDAPNKGVALERECATLGCDTAIYIGDDDTDEDVFRLDRAGRLLSIRVGRRGRSAAPYYIRGQSEIDRLLGSLVALRTAANVLTHLPANKRPRRSGGHASCYCAGRRERGRVKWSASGPDGGRR